MATVNNSALFFASSLIDCSQVSNNSPFTFRCCIQSPACGMPLGRFFQMLGRVATLTPKGTIGDIAL